MYKWRPASVPSFIGYLAQRGIRWLSLSIIGSIILMVINILKANYTGIIVTCSVSGDLQGVTRAIIAFVVLLVAGTASSFLAKATEGRFSALIVCLVKDLLGDHLVRIKSEHVDKISSGDMVSRLNSDAERLADFMERDFQNFVIKPLMALIAAAYIIHVNWTLFVVTFAYTPIGMVIANYINQQARQWYPRAAQSVGDLAGLTREAVTGIDIAKTYDLAGILGKKNKLIIDRLLSEEMQAGKYNALLQPACYALANFPRFAYFLYGGSLVIRDRLPIGTFVALIQLLDYIIGPSVWLPFVFNSLQRTVSSTKRIVEVLSLPTERAGGQTEIETSRLDAPVIDFQHVGFSYTGKKVLHDLCFEVAPLSTVALVGPSGGGKSTIFDLISGMVVAQEGRVSVFGADLKQVELATVRRQIAVVPQEAVLFPGSIAENIGFGNPDAKREEIIAAAVAADADSFIRELPEAYDTVVSERGLSLSGGQRQRIAIARAFLRNAPLLLLDEPTSALDSQTDAQVQKALCSLMRGRTVVVSAHRLGTIQQADQILVVDRGRIVEAGSHQQLMLAGGHYHQLVVQQMTDAEVKEEVSADA